MPEPTIKEVADQLGRDFEQFKAANDLALKELREKGVTDPVLAERVDRIAASLADLDTIKQRIEAVENAASRLKAGGGGDLDETAVKHKQAFEMYLRNPRDPEAQTALKQAEHATLKKRAVSGTSNEAGGYAVPEIISTEIEKNLIEISPMRPIARVVTAGSKDFKMLVDVRGMGYGWVGETGTRSETDTPTLEEVAPTFGTIYAYPKATEESLNDIFFDVGGWLRETAVEEFAKGEGIAFISGNGSNKPTGFLNGSPAATGDYDSPARAFGTLEYIPTGAASSFGNSRVDSPPGDPGDVFFTTAYTLKQGYRANARWLMNKNTLAVVMKFKDADGDYLWRPGLSAGQPSTLIGYPISEMQDMPDIGSNAFPVAFGDFRQGYLICDLVGLRITVDDNITTPGYVKWYMRRRVGGKILKDEAIKVIKCAAS